MNDFRHMTKKLVVASAALAIAILPAVTAAAAPVKPATTTSYSYGSEIGSFHLGGALGLGLGSDWTAFRIEARPQYTLLQLSPNFYLDIAGHLGFDIGNHGSKLFEIVPAARFRYLLNDKIAFYGDGGAGIAFYSMSEGGFSSSATWGVIRFAGGIQYKVAPTIYLVGEPMGLNIYFGDGSTFVYSLAVGALFRL